MKKIISLVLALMLMLTFCVPAFADDAISTENAPIECEPDNHGIIDIRKPGNYIISESCTVMFIRERVSPDEAYTLTIPENVTVTLTSDVYIEIGTFELFGTLDVSQGNIAFASDHLHIGDTGKLIGMKISPEGGEPKTITEATILNMTLFSGGNATIIVGIACFAAGFLVAMFVFKKKKQPKGEE